MNSTHKKRVAVLRGGPSSEHRASISSGKHVLEHIDREKYEVFDIYIDKKGQWHEAGAPVDPYTLLQFIDIVFNALHGEYGEDGTVQAILQDSKKIYTGSDVFASKIAIDKHATKTLLKKSGIKMPSGSILRPHLKSIDKELAEVWRTLHHPLIVKPNASGSAVGVSIARTFHELERSVRYILASGHSALVEEYITGEEVSVSVISEMRGEALYAAIPSHVRYTGAYLSNSIQNNKEYYVDPMRHFTHIERELVIRTAKHIHRELGLGQYSRIDFIVSPKGIYFIEANTLPGLSEHSIFVKALEHSGIRFSDFLVHIIEQSNSNKKRH
jgi:D-alanine-D-alanine ligase